MAGSAAAASPHPTSQRAAVAASIVICSRRMRRLLVDCLAAIESDGAVDWEVIVVVNGDDDGTAGAVRARFPAVRLIVNPANAGIAQARNQGIAVALGEVVVLLDADTAPPPGALRRLVATLRDEPRAGVVGPLLVTPDGSVQRSGRRFPTLLTKLRRRAPRWCARCLPDDTLPPPPSRPAEVGYVIGACQAIRREALGEVGVLDEVIFYGPEDVDLCLRMWRRGWRVLWDPGATIVHHEQRETRRRPLSPLMVRHAVALAYFFLKHRYLWRAPGFGHA